MKEKNMLNRTDNNNENNRGEINKKDLETEIYLVWQGHVDYFVHLRHREMN